MVREVCMVCGKERESIYEIRCSKCGGPFDIEIDFEYSQNTAKNFPYINKLITLGEGKTPIIKKR